MRKHKVKKLMALVFTIAALMVMNIVPVFAEGTELEGSGVKRPDGVTWEAVENYAISEDLAHPSDVDDGGKLQNGTYYFERNNKLYTLSQDELDKAIAGAKEKKQSGTTQKVQVELDDALNNIGVVADTKTAAASLKGFGKFISTIIGGIAIIITLGMALSSALDICYIAFPPLRNFCGDQLAMGESNAMVKQDKDGNLSLRWITDDAVAAVKTATIENGKNPFATYFKKRVWSYIILVILLYMLMSGNITILTNLALKAVEGILRVLGAL